MAEEARKSLLRKKELVSSYKERLNRSNGFVVFFNFQGIDALPLSDLRARVRALNGEIVVGRNTLLYRAFEDTPLVDHRDMFVGPSAALFAYGDVVSTTKTLIEFLKEVFDKEYRERIKGGLLDNKYMTPEDVVALAELPSREELVAKLMGVLMAPITQLAMTLKAVPQKLVLTLKAIEEQKS
ncbi:LSU ribosomal protein L10P [Hydrogenivirga caldilitoris]|uniref:Large ribosomal subunit protein uL10 n=1 Tax=Hydrogenivirga caldilitoris TaxID=246264 RepID=A0A497XXX9_9AQUI|nr:50S ribosomal protein L10 [Hydrogenivirga caldilitoris]RLJ71623.1 LSU ribosomal protein L10P [Hydrogenivirga caldilitoris]